MVNWRPIEEWLATVLQYSQINGVNVDKRVTPTVAPRTGTDGKPMLPRMVYVRGARGDPEVQGATRSRANVAISFNIIVEAEKYSDACELSEQVTRKLSRGWRHDENGDRQADVGGPRATKWDTEDFVPDDDNPSRVEYASRIIQVYLLT